jgi:hypothetical protein
MRRCLLMATVAASALAFSVGFGPAAALSPTGKPADAEVVLHKVQHTERGTDAGRGRAAGPGRDGVRSGDRGPRTELRSRNRDGDQRRHGRRGVDFDIYVGPGYSYYYGPAGDYDDDAYHTRAHEGHSDFNQCGWNAYWDGNACQLGPRP